MNVTIDATAPLHTVTISGGGSVRLFVVSSGITLSLTGLTLANGNTATSGGAIANNFGGTVNVTNSTFSGNAALNGGAISNSDTVNVTGSTFSGNSAALNGGAIANTFTSMLTFALSLSTVSGNTAGSNGPDIAGRVTSGGGNVIGDTSAASGFIASDKLNTDPKLAPLALNAPGTTQTFALLPGSPAIDILACPTDPITNATLATDARGVSRPQGAKCDSGSYESRGFTAGSPTGNNQSAPVTTAFTSPVGLTVSSASSEPVAGGQVTFTITAAMVGGASATFPAAGSCTLTSASVAVCPIGMTGTVAGPPFTANTVLGPFTILATGAGISGSTSFSETVTAGPATSFAVSGFPSPVVAGVSGTVTVTAKDALGNTATGYTGIVAITSSDAAAVLPANATLTNGVGSFSVTLKTAGMGPSITATDTVTTSITGQQTPVTVTPAAAASFTVSGFPSPTTSGVAGTVTVTAKDAFGNIAMGYTGTVHLTSTDAAAVLPPNATLTNGTGTFAVTLKTPGTQTITATDTLAASITGAQTGITVNGIAPATMPDASSLTTGTTLTVPPATGVRANDTNGTPAATITAHTTPAHGTLTLNSDGSFTYVSTAPYTLANGTGTFGTGSSTATVTLTVNAATVTSLSVTAPTGTGSGNSGTTSAPVLRAGATVPLTTTGNYSNGSTGSVSGITYTSSNPNVATVDPTTGTLTGIASGTATITVSAPNGNGGTVTTTITVTVTTGTGGGLMNPNPQPMVKAAATAAPGATIAPQPTGKPAGTGSGVQPQVTGATVTPEAQPARH